MPATIGETPKPVSGTRGSVSKQDGLGSSKQPNVSNENFGVIFSDATAQIDQDPSSLTPNPAWQSPEAEPEEDTEHDNPARTFIFSGSAAEQTGGPAGQPTISPLHENLSDLALATLGWPTRAQAFNASGQSVDNLSTPAARSNKPQSASVLGLPSSADNTSSSIASLMSVTLGTPSLAGFARSGDVFKPGSASASNGAALTTNLQGETSQLDLNPDMTTQPFGATSVRNGQRQDTNGSTDVAAFALLLQPKSALSEPLSGRSANLPSMGSDGMTPKGSLEPNIVSNDASAEQDGASTGLLAATLATDPMAAGLQPMLQQQERANKPQGAGSSGNAPASNSRLSSFSSIASPEDDMPSDGGPTAVEHTSQPQQAASDNRPAILGATARADASQSGTYSIASGDEFQTGVSAGVSLSRLGSRPVSSTSARPDYTSKIATAGLPPAISPSNTAGAEDGAEPAGDSGSEEPSRSLDLSALNENEARGSSFAEVTSQKTSLPEPQSTSAKSTSTSRDAASVGAPTSSAALDGSGHAASNTEISANQSPVQTAGVPAGAISVDRTKSSPEVQSSSPNLPMDSTAAAKWNVQASGPVKEITIRVEASSGDVVRLKVVDQVNQVEIGVRSSNASLASSLQKDLSSLTATLDRLGWKSELASAPTPAGMAASEANSGSNDQEPSHSQMAAEWWNNPDQNRRSPSDLWEEALNRQQL